MIIKIADTGIGINPKIKDKIFEPFIKGEKPGTGIGLTVVSFLIKKMDGNLQVYSKKDKGTTFEVKIPIRKRIYRLTFRKTDENRTSGK